MHSIVKDYRKGKDANPSEIGETALEGSGGTWFSFGGGKITEDDGSTKDLPVHGPYSAPWNFFKVVERAASYVLMKTFASRRTGKFFKKGDNYELDRRVQAASDGINISNKVTNKGEKASNTPTAVEHTYYEGGNGASIRTVDGRYIPIEEIRRTVAEDNGNDIDTRINSEFTGTPGKVMFFPEGEGGPVTIISGTMVGPDGKEQLIESFDIYRYKIVMIC